MLKIIDLQEVVAAQEEEDLHPDLAQTSRRQALRGAMALRLVTVEVQDIRLLMGNTIHSNKTSNTNSREDNMGVDSPRMATMLTISGDLTSSDLKERPVDFGFREMFICANI